MINITLLKKNFSKIYRTTLVFISVFTLASVALTPVASAASWIAPINLSNVSKHALEPSIAIANNGTLHVAWTEWTQDSNGGLTDFEIYYAQSSNNGGSFTAPVNISTSPNNFSGEPVISVAGDQSNQIHIAWVEYNPASDPNGTEVYYTHSADGGLTWPSANKRNVSSSAGPSGSAYLYADSTSSHNIHIAWSDYRNNGYGQIYYSKSADGGNTFSAPVNISNTGRDSDQPALVADSNAIHIVWQDNETLQVYYSRSIDAGVTFTPAQLRSNGAVAEPAIEPAIALDGQNRVHIVWTRFNSVGGSDISWAVSSDNGATFAAAQNRTNTPSTVSQTPTIASPGGGRVMIIWSESNTDGTTQNWDQNSSAGGSNWQASEAIGGPAQAVYEPSLVIKGSTLYLVWEENGVVKFTKGS